MNEVAQTIGVFIATYRRSSDLLRCLAALEKQRHQADEILLVVREDDTETRSSLSDFAVKSLPIRIITVSVPGVVAARNAGLDACKTDILAIIDDDTSPHVDWLSRVMQNLVTIQL